MLTHAILALLRAAVVETAAEFDASALENKLVVLIDSYIPALVARERLQLSQLQWSFIMSVISTDARVGEKLIYRDAALRYLAASRHRLIPNRSSLLDGRVVPNGIEKGKGTPAAWQV